MIRQITAEDTQQFCDLIVNMYSHLENLEWFSPMPFDYESVLGMIENPRFYIVGYFENEELCGVGSLDYKCGKLIGKIDFPKECDTNKLVEIGFHIVHTQWRGRGIMKELISHLLEYASGQGLEWIFGKVHENNLASSKSLTKCGFTYFNDFKKPVKMKDFVSLSSEKFFSKVGKENALKTLRKYNKDDNEIIVNYHILCRKLKN